MRFRKYLRENKKKLAKHLLSLFRRGSGRVFFIQRTGVENLVTPSLLRGDQTSNRWPWQDLCLEKRAYWQPPTQSQVAILPRIGPRPASIQCNMFTTFLDNLRIFLNNIFRRFRDKVVLYQRSQPIIEDFTTELANQRPCYISCLRS